jgi:glycosyltransferase involved in cell wall biosynthesis
MPSWVTFCTVLNGWGKLKNAAVALTAFQKVRLSLPRVRLLMFGDDYADVGPAHAWAHKRGLDRGVEFVGPVPHEALLSRLSAEIDILVHPSLQESFGLAIAEAMALGIPVIGGFRCGGVAHTLEHGNAGLLSNVRSARHLAQAMTGLGRDSQLQHRLGLIARASAARRFKIHDVAAAYEALYRSTAGGKDSCESYKSLAN